MPMDDDGLRVDLLEETLDRLAAEGARVKLLYTIPNFQNPGRRVDVAGAARAPGRRSRTSAS